MAELTKELMDALNDPETTKVLGTTDEDGCPHVVFKGSLIALDDGNIAYAELIETSLTQKNMLRNFWNKKPVAISVLNQKKKVNYQIKGEAYKFHIEGPVWDQFLERIWSRMPDANPSGVWEIIPLEVINQDYEIRLKEEMRRRPTSNWFTIIGKRP